MMIRPILLVTAMCCLAAAAWGQAGPPDNMVGGERL